MGVERIDYYSDEEYGFALDQEVRAEYFYQQPDIDRCIRCGEQMYVNKFYSIQQLCETCKKIEGGL